MSLTTKRWIIASMSAAFVASLLFVQWREVIRKQDESGTHARHIAIPATSMNCVECHQKSTPGIIDHWKGSTHAVKGVGCVECHKAEKGDIDGFDHYGAHIATVVTPRDCGRCQGSCLGVRGRSGPRHPDRGCEQSRRDHAASR